MTKSTPNAFLGRTRFSWRPGNIPGALACVIVRRALARLDDDILCDLGFRREDLRPCTFAGIWNTRRSPWPISAEGTGPDPALAQPAPGR